MFADQRKDHRYYEIIARTLENDFVHSYFAIVDRAGSIRAVQPFFLLDQDVLDGIGPEGRRLVAHLRRLYPRFLRMRTLMVGCAAGEAHLAAADGLSETAVADILSREIVELARRQRAPLVVLKEFPARYRDTLACFVQRGFTRAPSMPMTMLNIQYASFEDYMQKALPRSARWDLRKKFRATADATDICMVVTDDIEPLADEIYRLYSQVFDRSSLRFEQLTKESFIELGRRMKDKTRFFIWRRGNAMLAFSLCMVQGDCLFSEYVGFDYAVALDLHLYHYTLRDVINWAIDNGYKWFRSSGLNYEPKFRMRQALDPLDLYVRHTSPLANAALRIAMPYLAPVRYDRTLRRFSNYRDLW
jgi:predicted N-acyltransferase